MCSSSRERKRQQAADDAVDLTLILQAVRSAPGGLTLAELGGAWLPRPARQDRRTREWREWERSALALARAWAELHTAGLLHWADTASGARSWITAAGLRWLAEFDHLTRPGKTP